ncbi:MAG: helix-turn-helix domain-containing protein [Bacteroidales bacterium]
MEQIHVGKLINEQVPPFMSKAKLARLIGVSQPAIARILNAETIQVKRLLHVSERLNCNFFRVIGEQLPIEEPSFAEATEGKDKEIAVLTAELERLREENRYLKKAIDLIGPS